MSDKLLFFPVAGKRVVRGYRGCSSKPLHSPLVMCLNFFGATYSCCTNDMVSKGASFSAG